MSDRTQSAGGATADVAEESQQVALPGRDVPTSEGADGPEAGGDGPGAQPSRATGGAGEGAGEQTGGANEPTEGASRSSPRRRRSAPRREVSEEDLVREIAALLFASPDPLSPARLAQLLGGPEPARVGAAIEELGRRLEAAGLPVRPRQIAGGWQLLTVPEADEIVARLARERRKERLSAAALETLAVVAYRQPVTKAEVEAIRGVQAGPILRNLVDRGLIHVTGRADVPGHPLQYGTTREFLARFGLASLEDLPRDGELLE